MNAAALRDECVKNHAPSVRRRAELVLRQGARHWLRLVMGNDGWDVVSDYGWDGGADVMKPAPGTFAHAIETATAPFIERYS